MDRDLLREFARGVEEAHSALASLKFNLASFHRDVAQTCQLIEDSRLALRSLQDAPTICPGA